MNRNQNLDSFTPTSQPTVMKEAEYPVTPTKPRENQSTRNDMGNVFSTPQSDVDSTQPATPSSTDVEEHIRYNGAMSATQNRDVKRTFWHNKDLRRENKKLGLRNRNLHDMNNSLKARVEQLTAACSDMHTENTRNNKYKDIVFKISAPYTGGQGLNSDDLTSEIAQGICNTISSEAETSKHLRAQLETLEAQIEALRKDLMASRLQCQSLEKHQSDEDSKLQVSLQNLESYRAEARGLRNQVQTLQKEMLSQVSSSEAISDEVFSRDFRTLASLVKSLSRSVQPAQNVDILEALKPNVLLRDVPKHYWDTRARKKAYVEAWIWSVLISAVFRFSFGVCEDFITLHENWCFIFGNDWFNDWPKPTPESETWRLTTVDKLVEDIGRETLIRGQSHGICSGPNAHHQYLQNEALKSRRYVANKMKSRLTAVGPTSDLSYVSDIVDKAFELALKMSLQRFRVQVTWPNTLVRDLKQTG